MSNFIKISVVYKKREERPNTEFLLLEKIHEFKEELLISHDNLFYVRMQNYN